MELITTVADGGAQALALNRALDAYNARNPALTASQFLQKLVDGQLAQLVASYVVTKVDSVDFMQRFTADERIAVRNAAKTDAHVDDFYELLKRTPQVDLTHPTTAAGMQLLVSLNLVTAERSTAILAL